MLLKSMMHNCCLAQDTEFIGKQEDLYLWTYIRGLKTTAAYACQMHNMLGHHGTSQSLETKHHLTLLLKF
jgi:hypothetical protein